MKKTLLTLCLLLLAQAAFAYEGGNISATTQGAESNNEKPYISNVDTGYEQPIIPPVGSSTMTVESKCQPVCKAIGTKSEGWYDSCTGELLKWAVCGSESGSSGGPSAPPSGECICTMEYYPVCGADARTYSNKCLAYCAGTVIKYVGKCEEQAQPPTTNCKEYKDDKGCVVTECNDGKSSIWCQTPTEPNCKKYIDEQGCTVKVCEDGKKERYCPTNPADCEKYVDEKGCVVKKCSDGTFDRECPPITTQVDCKSYADEQGCKVVYCTDGSKKVDCSGQNVECKKYVDEKGCTVKVCKDGKEGKYCPTKPEECKVYDDPKNPGCKIKECTNGYTVQDCPTTTTQCKYYLDEKGCKVKACEDGSTETNCPNPNTCKEVQCKQGYNCVDGQCIAECKKVDLGNGCVKKVCSDGYEATYCQTTGQPQAPIECKEYQNEQGCVVKVCANGYEKKYCPEQTTTTEEIKCKKYTDDSGCTTRVCEDGFKAIECPNARKVEVKALEQMAKVNTMKEGKDVESSVDTSTTTVEATVSSSGGGSGKVGIKKSPNGIEITSNSVPAETTSDVSVENSELTVGNVKVKVLPDQASEKAKQVIAALNVKKISIKEQSGKTVYSVQGIRNGRLLFLIPVDVEMTANIDASTNEVVGTEAPWWNFLVG